MGSSNGWTSRNSGAAETGRYLHLITHPLGVLWLLFAAALVGGIVQWLIADQSPREGIAAAATIGGVIKIVAKVKGISAWPPTRVRETRSAHGTD